MQVINYLIYKPIKYTDATLIDYHILEGRIVERRTVNLKLTSSLCIDIVHYTQ